MVEESAMLVPGDDQKATVPKGRAANCLVRAFNQHLPPRVTSSSPTHADAERPDYASSSISDQLHAPRLFEVKRNGGMLSFPWVSKIEPNNGGEPDKMKPTIRRFPPQVR